LGKPKGHCGKRGGSPLKNKHEGETPPLWGGETKTFSTNSLREDPSIWVEQKHKIPDRTAFFVPKNPPVGTRKRGPPSVYTQKKTKGNNLRYTFKDPTPTHPPNDASDQRNQKNTKPKSNKEGRRCFDLNREKGLQREKPKNRRRGSQNSPRIP